MRQPDPIVEEVRAAREVLFREYEYDIKKLAEGLRAKDLAEKRVLVSPPPRKVKKAG